MPRISRPVAVGYPHHITQRGNYRQNVFESDGDYLQYLDWLQQYSRKYSLKIWAYCLMNNHVHFVAVPLEITSLAKTFHTLHMRYSQYINQKRGAVGHLWQGRFFSCALDEPHLYAAVRYVENNAVRAKIVEKASDYKWSSARSRIYKESDHVLSGDCYLTEQIQDWFLYLEARGDDVMVNTIRSNSKTGRPCGDDGFIHNLNYLPTSLYIGLPFTDPYNTIQIMNTSRYLKTFFLLLTLTFLFSCSKLPQIPTQMTMESTMGSIEHKGNLSGLQVAGARLPTLPAPESEPPSSISSSVSSSTSPSPSTLTLTSRPEGELSQAFQEKASQLKLLARPKESRDYVLGPRDIIKITVWGHEDLTRQVTISQEGSFSYPFIGDVVAEGKTAALLEQEIAQRLDVRFIINPQVNINIEAYKSKIAYVIGEVVRKDNKESGFPLIGQTTIFEILSQAGGPTTAAGSEVLVIRPSTQLRKSNPLSPDQAQKNEIITINLWKLMVGDQTQNIYLESGDTVYVPKAEYFYVYGEVKSPGKFNLEKGANILKGIAIAGGATEKAALSRTKLVRERDGIRIEINKVKLDELIQPEDIIMIPESFF